MRIATIDVGTNTALLLVADTAGGVLTPLQQEQRFVRLGEGVDGTGRISGAAMERLKAALLEYRSIAGQWEVSETIVTGTSASRDARNGEELVEFVRRETGLAYEVLSGAEEALWSFAGAVSAYEGEAGPCTTLDIGGGSTEVTVGRAGVAPWDVDLQYRHSFDVGAVRLTERFFSQQPPLVEEIGRAERLVRDLLDGADLPAVGGQPFIGVAGTVSALAAVHVGASLKEDAIAESLAVADVHTWRQRLLSLRHEEVLALHPAAMQGRADVFPAGVLILDLIMQRLGVQECLVSSRDLRHGLALRFMQERSAMV